jgi:putative Mg2+ transporter-C (MgtC) family protein
MLEHWELLLRIAVGGLLGAIVGIERNRASHPAGLRMHVIVALAAATFMVCSAHFAFFQGYEESRLVNVDPSRIAASVVTGIGFLGGGAILRTGATIQGLTTAAALWLVTASGLCAGAGMFPEAVFVTGVGVLALASLRPLEHKDVMRRRVSLVLANPTPARVDEVIARVSALGAAVSELDYERCLDHRTGSVSFDVRLTGNVAIADFLGALEGQPGVSELRVHAPIE